MTFDYLNQSLGLHLIDAVSKNVETIILGTCSLFLLTGMCMFFKIKIAVVTGLICTLIVILSHDNPFIFYGS